jgi:hypothetical protein
MRQIKKITSLNRVTYVPELIFLITNEDSSVDKLIFEAETKTIDNKSLEHFRNFLDMLFESRNIAPLTDEEYQSLKINGQ